MNGLFLGNGPFQRQSIFSELAQVIAQALSAAAVLCVVLLQLWLQARVLGFYATGGLLIAVAAVVLYVEYERRSVGRPARKRRVTLAMSAAVVGLLLIAFPGRRVGMLAAGRLWLTVPAWLVPLVRVTSFTVSLSALALASVGNLAIAAMLLLAAVRLAVEVVYPNLLNSIRATAGLWPGMCHVARGVTYTDAPEDEGAGEDAPHGGGVRARGVRVE